MMFTKSVVSCGLVLMLSGLAFGAVSKEEAQQLGKTLTPIGAEKAGNKDGSIPEYTGGLVTANQKKGKISRKDPFANEKPVFSITGKDMSQYSNKLTEGVKALLKKHPTYRVDVYKTHRSAALPKWVNDATMNNAGKAATTNDGNGISNAHAFYPFPIPKTGNEAMWNHLLTYAPNQLVRSVGHFVDANGRVTLTGDYTSNLEFPYWDLKRKDSQYFRFVKQFYRGPARRAGEGRMLMDSLVYSEYMRKAWQYLPGQRRVKLAPDLGFDAPDPATSGATTFDDNLIFNGSLEKYNWKLVGKKEMYIPYNAYKLAYNSTPDDLLKKGHINPDFARWELHRVWVVEAALKPGKRHIYQKRVFYLDEDSWIAVASDEYDSHGQLYRAGIAYSTPSHEYPTPMAQPYGHYDLTTGEYTFIAYTGPKGSIEYIDALPESDWSPSVLVGSGVR